MQIINRMKKLLPIFFLLPAAIFLFSTSEIAKQIWFHHTQQNQITINGHTIEMESGWFQFLSTESDIFIRIQELLSGKNVMYPTVGLKTQNCNDIPECIIKIKILPEGSIVSATLTGKVKAKHRTKWEVLNLVDTWVDQNGNNKFVYYFNEADLLFVVSDPDNLSSIIDIKPSNPNNHKIQWGSD